MYIRVMNGEIIMASKNCANCGALLDLDAKFCSNCGAVQKTATSSVTANIPTYNYANVPLGYYAPQPNPNIIQVMAIIEIVIGILGLLGSMFIGYFLYYIYKYSGANNNYVSHPIHYQMYVNNWNFIIAIIVIILIVILIASFFTIMFGIGLYKFRSWGRIGSMVIGGINLLNFPLGTLFGVAMLYLLTRPENIRLFTQNNISNAL